MHWTEQISRRDNFVGAPDLPDGDSRVAEAMGGLADDEYLPPNPASIADFAADLDDHDRVHEAMGGMCSADEL